MKRKSRDDLGDLMPALRAAIDEYRQMIQNDHGHAVLDRLLDHPDRVLPVFAAAGDRWTNVLFACVHAGEEQRLHKERKEQADRDIEAAPEAKKALNRVEEYLARGSRSVPVSDAMAFPLLDNSSELGPIEGGGIFYPEDERKRRAAIDLLRSQIDAIQRRARDELGRRSQKTDAAGRRATAVGWIKAAVRKSAPSASSRKVIAELAAVVLEDDKVHEDGVRHAKTPREWLAR